jgi:hypothetical protein
MRKALCVVAVLAAGAAASPAGARAAPGLAVRTSITPASAAVGQQVAATVEVAMDPSAVDPASVRIQASVAPLDLERQARTVTQGSALAVVTERLGAACLSEGCLPVRGPLAITPPPVRVSARARDGAVVTASAGWPALQLVPRVTTAEASPRSPAWQVQHDLPALTTRVSPRALERIFTVLGILLAVAAGVLVALGARRAPRPAAIREPTLADALASVRRAAQGTKVEDRRVALDLLARTLAGHGDGHAARARDLAWSEPRPSAEGMESLALEVEREEAGR